MWLLLCLHWPTPEEVIWLSFGALKAKKGDLAIEDMDGGTFTISNGGVFGSLMGTPIINPPQSAILGMHGIFDRPVAVKGEVCSGVIAQLYKFKYFFLRSHSLRYISIHEFLLAFLYRC